MVSFDDLERVGEVDDEDLAGKVFHFYPKRNDHVRGHGWTIYCATPYLDHQFYVKSRTGHYEHWYGCDRNTADKLFELFDKNPFMVRQ